MRTAIRRFEPFRGLSLQDQFNRLFNESFDRSWDEASLTTWAPAVDIFETEQELVVKADLPDIKPEELDIRVENNLLTIRGERQFGLRPFEDETGQIETERVVGLLEDRPSGPRRVVKAAAHADSLRPLSGKEKGDHGSASRAARAEARRRQPRGER